MDLEMESDILPWYDVMELMNTDSTLHIKWNELYSFKDEVKKLRLRCHEFLAEDKCWNQALKAYEEKSWQTDGMASESLYNLLITSYQEKCQNTTVDGIIISGELAALQDKYDGKHSELITDLLVCLHGERQVLLPENQVEDMDTMEKDGILYNVQKLDMSCKELDKHIKNYDNHKEILEEVKKKLHSLYESNSHQNGLIPQHQLEIALQTEKISQTLRNIVTTLCSIVENAGKVLTELQNEMQHWRMEQKKYYVDVATKPSMPSKPPLTKWCAHAGQVLFDLIRCTLPNIPVDGDQNNMQKIQEIKDIFQKMLQCSFVVTDQVKNFIKVSMGTKKKGSDGQDDDEEDGGGNKKFSCPKFKATVTLLAAAFIDSVEPVHAYFVNEDSLAQVDDPATYDFSKSKYPLRDTKQKGSSATVDKGTGNATFKTLELKSFNREKESVVAKEKFRIMFQTKLKVGDRLIQLWTMSLPIVVITGASQQCNACGSLLWHCLNPADEGQFPPPVCPETLQWSEVKELLNTKLKYLGGRGLSQDEEKHLVSRITGNLHANIEEDPVISFNRFCIDKMMDINDPSKKTDDRKKSATFWMWFQAVYNLINTHLKEYWKRELILGFLNKDQAIRCLEGVKPNTFLLRFSKNIITDAQGQNMCGAISVSYINGGGTVDHMTPSIADKLKDYNMALTLKRMINGKTNECEMKWVYPSMKPREEVYKDFLDVDPAPRKFIDGYTKLKEMLVIDPVEKLTDSLGKLTTEVRPKKRPVHKVKGNRSDNKVAKVMGQAVPNQYPEHIQDGVLGEMGHGQQSGNIPTISFETEPNAQPPTTLMSIPDQGLRSATSSRAFSVPAVSDVSTNQNSPLARSQSFPHANKYPSLQNLLSEPVMDGLKSKLSANSAQYPQGVVEINKDIGLSCAKDRMDMSHIETKTITGGNDGFSQVESKVKPCNSPAATLPMFQGHPQSQTFMHPKIEAKSPLQNVQPLTPSYNQTLQSLLGTTQINGTPVLVPQQMMINSQQSVAPVITEPNVSQHGGLPTALYELDQHELFSTDFSEGTSQQIQQENGYPSLEGIDKDLWNESLNLLNTLDFEGLNDMHLQNAN